MSKKKKDNFIWYLIGICIVGWVVGSMITVSFVYLENKVIDKDSIIPQEVCKEVIDYDCIVDINTFLAYLEKVYTFHPDAKAKFLAEPNKYFEEYNKRCVKKECKQVTEVCEFRFEDDWKDRGVYDFCIERSKGIVDPMGTCKDFKQVCTIKYIKEEENEKK